MTAGARLWAPRATRQHVEAPTPEHRFDADVGVPFGRISDRPCIALLGEPGLGKSTEIRFHFMAARQVEPARHAFVDLGLVTDGAHLRSAIARALAEWTDRDATFTLWIDALDEVQAMLPNAARLLAAALREHRSDLLCLRITCRVAEWPVGFGEELVADWGEAAVLICDLVPLTIGEVAEAARAARIDHAAFGAWLDARCVRPLAARPITLGFLIAEFQSGRHRTDVWDLYEGAMVRLAGEPQATRRDLRRARRDEETTTAERVDLAARIAALAHLSDRRLVERDEAPHRAGHGEMVPLSAVTGPDPLPERAGRTITVREIRDAMATAIFAGAGTDALRFAHQTFGEFLAARYILSLRLEPRRLLRVLGLRRGVPTVPAPRREFLAWIAGRDRGVFDHLASTQPEILLESDSALQDDAGRAVATRAWLAAVAAKRVSLGSMPRFRDYQALVHPGIESILAPILDDHCTGFLVRRTAIEIAGQAATPDLLERLLRIALDEREDVHLRISSAHEVRRNGDVATRRRLRPLLDVPQAVDADDELYGDALRALFPGTLSWPETLARLRAPQRAHLVGTYSVFLHEIAEAPIAREDLDVLLPWLVATSSDGQGHTHLRPLMARVLRDAWWHVDEVAVARSVAEVVLRTADHHGEVFDLPDDAATLDAIMNDPARRAIVLRQVLELLAQTSGEAWRLLDTKPRLLLDGELRLLLRAVPLDAPVATRRVADDLVLWFFGSATREDLEALYERVQCDAEFRSTRQFFEGVPTDGPVAEAARRHLAFERKMAERRRVAESEKEQAIAAYGPRLRVELTAAIAGEREAWYRFCSLLANPPTERGPEQDTTLLEQFPGWSADTDLPEHEIARAAAAYLRHFVPSGAQAFITNQRPTAGDRAWIVALRWMLRHAEAEAVALDDETWTRATALVWGHRAERELLDEDIALAARLTLDRAEPGALDAIVRQLRRGAPSELLQLLDRHWRHSVHVALRREALARRVKPSWAAIAILLRRGDPAVWKRVRGWVTRRGRSATALARAIEAAGLSFAADPRRAWPMLRPLFSRPDAGHALMLRLAGSWGSRDDPRWDVLDESDLAELYLWLRAHVPPRPGIDDLGARAVGPDDELDWFRDSLLSRLRNRGTDGAVQALQTVASRLPDWWLQHMPWEAVRAALDSQARTLSPADAARLLADSAARHLATVGDLLDLVSGLVEDYEAWLHDHLPAIADLWEERADGAWRPVRETRFSTHLARFMRDALRTQRVVVNREVEIRPRRGRRAGERTDILVQCPVQGELPVIAVVVEIKGCWNLEAPLAMRSQLLDRYLTDAPGAAGFYVVGYFGRGGTCGRRCAFRSLDAARAALVTQAVDLASSGRTIEASVIDARLEHRRPLGASRSRPTTRRSAKDTGSQ